MKPHPTRFTFDQVIIRRRLEPLLVVCTHRKDRHFPPRQVDSVVSVGALEVALLPSEIISTSSSDTAGSQSPAGIMSTSLGRGRFLPVVLSAHLRLLRCSCVKLIRLLCSAPSCNPTSLQPARGSTGRTQARCRRKVSPCAVLQF